MTEIDFYVLGETQSRMDFALRLCKKVFALKHQIFVFTENRETSEAFSEALWSIDESSFLANCLIDADQSDTHTDPSPIKIAHNICKDSAPLLNNDVLINLSMQVPPHFSRFQRHVEIVGDNESVRDKLRENHSFYKQRGYPLKVHKLG